VIANRFYSATSISLVLLLGYLSYRILQPFIHAIAWAVVFAIVFYPVYAFLVKFVKAKSLASIATLFLIIIVIIGPVTYFSFILVDEIGNLVQRINKETFDSIINVFTHLKITQLIDRIQSYMGMQGAGNADTLMEGLRSLGQSVAHGLSSGIGNLAGMILDFILMLFALFFFLKDGQGILLRIRDYLPFSEEDKNRLISKIRDMVISTVYGGAVIAVLQGLLGGIGFYFLGITSPVLWGCAMTIMSFLPLLGTFSIWGPAAGFLFIEGYYVKAIILLVYGIFVITTVDNILRPVIISGRTKMPALAVFFSVLGGIKLFGPIGFIMGPLVVALFVSVFEIFRNIEGGQNAK
jgi:predicted PurR-regulated permease PerM